MSVNKCFNNKATTGVSGIISYTPGKTGVFRVEGVSAGAVSATVKLMGSTINSTTGGVELASFALSGTSIDVAGTSLEVHWPYLWYDITALGAGTTIDAEIVVGD